MFKAISVAFLTLPLLSTTVSAAPVSFGSLTYDAAVDDEIFTDSYNDLEWLRWDVLADLTYLETKNAIAVGGAYEGWTIADASYAQAFVDAAIGAGNNCTTSQTAFATCSDGYVAGDLGAVVGDNFTVGSSSFDYDYAWFETGHAVGEVGSVGSVWTDANDATVVRKYGVWGSYAGSDNFSGGGDSVSWLLYRSADLTPVPVPAALPLLLGGLGALGLARVRRARSAA